MKSLEKAAERLLKEDPEISGAMQHLQIAAASISTLDDDGFVTVLAYVGYPEGLMNAFRRFSVDDPLPLAEAYRTGVPIWMATAEEHEARYPSVIATFASNSDRRGWASIPFLLAGEARCAFAVSFRNSQVLSPAIRAQTEAVAARVAALLAHAVAA